MADEPEESFEADPEKSDGDALHFDSREEQEDFERMYGEYLESKEEECANSDFDEFQVYLNAAFNQEPGSCVRIPEGALPCKNLSMYFWQSELDGPIALYVN